MKHLSKIKNTLKLLALAIVFNTSILAFAQNTIKINTLQAKDTISRHIYGHFSEHLGHCIYEGLWVGESSKIANVKGIRADVVNALREIAIPNLRWPGGCFADEYHWRNGIGPKSDRPTMINTNWGGVTEDNSFGTHEFMELCKQLNCEPVYAGNLGSGTVEEMSQWVEYLNSDNISPMTDLRKTNGQEKAWGVKYWNFGNEAWGCGGAMRPEYYFDQIMRYSTFCRDYGANKLFRVAVGPSDKNYNWTEVLLSEWAKKEPGERQRMNGLSLHYYTVCHNWDKKGSATVFDEKEWFTTMSKTLEMQKFINKHTEIMDKYDPENKIALIVDEWGNWHDVEPGTNPGFLFQQNTLRDALVAGINLNIFNNSCHRVKMANIAQIINVLQSVILTKNDIIVRTPTFYVFKMYKVHHDAQLLPIEISTEQYTLNGESIPAVTASASKDKQGKTHITLTNVNLSKDVEIECAFDKEQKLKISKAEIVTAKTMNAYNDFGKPEEINIKEFKGAQLVGGKLKIKIPAKSVVMVELM